MAGEGIDVVFGLDTTGSMYPCLSRVRRVIRALVKRLFAEVSDIRIAVIAHGDYCDRGSTYVTKKLDFSRDENRICDFVGDVAPTGGGDARECYEFEMHEVRSLKWEAKRKRAFVMVGDELPHLKNEPQNTLHLDWRNEAKMLKELGVAVYPVQALGKAHATSFYQEVAELTGGCYLELDQFDDLGDVLMGVCYQQAGPEHLQRFEAEVLRSGRMNNGVEAVLLVLSGRPPAKVRAAGRKSGLESVPRNRFQVMHVDEEQPIQDFVDANSLIFKRGCGFYEFKTREKIQWNKEVILRDRKTRAFFTGREAVRKTLGLPLGTDPKTSNWEGRPKDLLPHNDYKVFVASTSLNRNLEEDSEFLYEVDLDR